MRKSEASYGKSLQYTLSPDKFRDTVKKETSYKEYGVKALKFTGLTAFILSSLVKSVIKEKCNNKK